MFTRYALPKGEIRESVGTNDSDVSISDTLFTPRTSLRNDKKEAPMDEKEPIASALADTYQCVKVLGEGAAGITYQIVDTQTAKNWAMK